MILNLNYKLKILKTTELKQKISNENKYQCHQIILVVYFICSKHKVHKLFKYLYKRCSK